MGATTGERLPLSYVTLSDAIVLAYEELGLLESGPILLGEVASSSAVALVFSFPLAL